MRILATLALLATASPAAADAPVARLSVVPWSAYDGVERPYRYIVELEVEGDGPVEAAFDRRLLSFELRAEGRRRRVHRCRHPRAPRTTRRARTRVLEASGRRWREWIDIRMYCWGRALRAFDAGGELRPRYGWRRATRARWIARVPGARRARDMVGGVTLEPFMVRARPEDEDRTTRVVAEGEEAPPSELSVVMTPRSASRAGGLYFRVSVGAVEGSERVYVRPDAFSFLVRGPDDTVRCRMPRGGGSPPPDFFRRVTTRRRAVELLEATAFCPDDAFERPGVYEVIPKLRLPHSGEEWNLGAVTGRFAGPPAAVRILSGDVAYGEQIPRRAGEEPEETGDDDG